jgi:hypothetical protein
VRRSATQLQGRLSGHGFHIGATTNTVRAEDAFGSSHENN